MPSTSEISIFQRANPAIALWMQDPANESEGFYGELCLDNHDRDYVYSRLTINHHAEDGALPARMYDAVDVPNGDWTVQTSQGVVFQYRIWLVQSGRLQGYRIIKIRNPRTNQYSGFAYLTRAGEVKVWTRFARDEHAPHVEAIREIVRRFLHNDYDPEAIQYSIVRRCPICNNLASDDARVMLCSNHAYARDNHPGDGYLMSERRTIAVRSDVANTSTTYTMNATTIVTDLSESDEESGSTVLLCQNGTGLVR